MVKIKKKNGIMYWPSTPKFLLMAEQLHLTPDFNHRPETMDEEHENIKLLPPQLLSSLVATGPYEGYQKERLNFTNNGIYQYVKCIARNVAQIDVHSLLPTMAYQLGLLDERHKKLFLEKKEIEADTHYPKNKRLVAKRKRIKLQLNKYCSTIGETKVEHSINRFKAMYSGMNMVFDMLNYWGLSNVINCVNDGFIVTNFNEEKFEQFKEKYSKKIKYLTFSIKQYDYCLVKNDLEYLLINNDGDYKCRNRQFGQNSVYELLTGKSLKYETVSFDGKALLEAERIEKEAMEVCKNLFLKTNH
ncbi:hypothetical protein [Limosilactobacillus reuteri]|uniref:hypothetical protein n=2 Tax=Limosilactobacillus reuteri TaxID=1598 RepID=UPI00081BD484|nr:hypothetical protein [Limosilactobacillus reuteri]MCH5380332.1 hypothetical protein [Limosilactobacillus reuteri]MCT3208774.1 hypothetical protein [Limosilactobacillus reuteri]MCT3217297.1 hypothetical protein [Limosilactobacillus reuteri]OCW61938.1 hypothetical protein BBP10_08860 [Limosilactobacillus reuteri]OCW62617.1 hypothetical protein BBP11_08820 [Limosilactobacillus reuteri]